jgi:hypothetical protein
LRGFQLHLFYEKWSYLPGCPAKFAAPGKNCPAPIAARQLSPGRIFRMASKSMFKQI